MVVRDWSCKSIAALPSGGLPPSALCSPSVPPGGRKGFAATAECLRGGLSVSLSGATQDRHFHTCVTGRPIASLPYSSSEAMRTLTRTSSALAPYVQSKGRHAQEKRGALMRPAEEDPNSLLLKSETNSLVCLHRYSY